MNGPRYFLLILFVVCLFASPPAALATGTFVDAPGRVDMVYDDARGILYITSGGSVLRYHVGSNSFLDPFALGGNLKGIDLSPDGNTLVVADQSYSASEVWVHVAELDTGLIGKATFPRAFYEGGTFAVAFGNDGMVLVTSSFLGSGWTPMRRFDPFSYQATEIASVRQDTMVKAASGGSAIAFAESNISDGRFGRYRVADGDLLRKSGYTDGTGYFNYEIGVNRDGTQYAIPTYGGTFLYDRDLVRIGVIGQYAAGQPIGVAYHPVRNLVYFPWAATTKVYAYDAATLERVAEYDFESQFDHPGNRAFVEGRLKMSRDGSLLFATVEGGIRYVAIANSPPVAEPRSLSTAEDRSVTVKLSGFDPDRDPLTYAVTEMPAHGTLSGSAPDLVYAPGPDYNGPDRFAFTVNDGQSDSSAATVDIAVAAVNDPPSFALAAPRIGARHNGGPQVVPGWAGNIAAGPPDESAQTVTFLADNDNLKLFSQQPSIDSAGTLSFAPARGRKGSARVTVRARDNGGTWNGGADQSAPSSFVIDVY